MRNYTFFEHPDSVCLTYSEHFNLSIYFSKILLIGSIKSIIHGLIPFLYLTSTSDTVNKIFNILNQIGCRN